MSQFSLFNMDEFARDETYLFFDTETNGLPREKNAPLEDLDNWPRLIQLAWIQMSVEQEVLSKGDYLIYPETFYIFESVHGITNEQAVQQGQDLTEVLNKFAGVMNESTVLVAHNIEFDERVVGAEFLRQGINNNLAEIRKICTMKSSKDYCAIKSGNRFKYPKLAELHVKLFNESFEGAHDALVDVEALIRCFWELKQREVISIF